MKINIVLSRSQQPENACSMGDSEQDHMGAIIDLVAANLQKDSRFNVLNIQPLHLPGKYGNLAETVRQSNEFIENNGGKGYHLAAHSDGGYNGKGASAFYFSAEGLKFVREIYTEVSRFWDSNMGIRAYPDLYELHRTKAVASLIEIGFHDRMDDAKKIHDNYQWFANAITRGIYKGVGLMPNTESAPTPNEKIAIDIAYWKKAPSELTLAEVVDRINNIPFLLDKLAPVIRQS